MGHFHSFSPEHKRLLQRLDAGSVTLAEPKEAGARAGWQEILEILYSPEDAALAARIPVLPTSLEALARTLGTDVASVQPRLEVLCDRGVVVDLVHPETGDVRYMLAPPVIGFFEFSMMRAKDGVPKDRMARAMEAYLHHDDSFMQEVFCHDTVIGRSLVYETALGAEQLPDVVDFERASALVRDATKLAVGLCYCRHRASHVGRACDAPQEVCMALNAAADFVTRRRFGRALDKSEALELLAMARERRLVQTTDNVQNRPLFLCNCCGCCCDQLQAINRYDIPAVNPSGFQAHSNAERCVGCGRCARTCPIGAITLVPSRASGQHRTALQARVNPERCIGCGVCTTACHKDALHMETRPGKRDIPVNTLDRSLRMAIERGHLGPMLYELAAQHRLGWLGKALDALVSLPPAQKLLAHQQVRSRFVQATLKFVKDPTGG